MTFPPPTPTPTPTKALATPPTTLPPRPSVNSSDTQPLPTRHIVWPTLSAAGWLATTGATMLLLAAIVVVAGRWQSITPEIRFAGLVAALLGVYFTAETLRGRLTTTATALAALAAALTAPVGIAASATLGQAWPTCVVVGGVAALLAAELQSRRWGIPTLKAATVVAAGLAATGLAALLGAPIAVVGASVAALLRIGGAAKRSVVLAIGVGCTPALIGLSDLGVGRGTLADIGATGAVLEWGAPLGCAIASLVVAVTAHTRREMSLVAVSVAILAAGAIVGASGVDAAPFVWWCLPGVVLIVVELTAMWGRQSVWAGAARRMLPVAEAALGIGAAVTPIVVAADWVFTDMAGTERDPGWVLPLATTAAAMWMATIGNSRREGGPGVFAALFAASSSATFATALAVGPTTLDWLEVGTVAGIATLAAALGRTRHAAWQQAAAMSYVGAGVLSLLVLDVSAGSAALILVVAGSMLFGLASVRRRFAAAHSAALVASGIAVVTSLAASATITSITLAIASAHVALSTAARHGSRWAAFPAGVSAAASVSLWWTTGTHDAVIAAIAPYDADGGDVALALATVTLLAAGGWIRRLVPVSSWLAYSPGLGLTTAWLLEAQFDAISVGSDPLHTGGSWPTVSALAIGLGATAIGGYRRLGAPLVIGTGLMLASILISAGPRLAAAPTWLWIALGGFGLLTLAGVVERSDRPLVATRDDGPASLLQQFRVDFE